MPYFFLIRKDDPSRCYVLEIDEYDRDDDYEEYFVFNIDTTAVKYKSHDTYYFCNFTHDNMYVISSEKPFLDIHSTSPVTEIDLEIENLKSNIFGNLKIN